MKPICEDRTLTDRHKTYPELWRWPEKLDLPLEKAKTKDAQFPSEEMKARRTEKDLRLGIYVEHEEKSGANLKEYPQELRVIEREFYLKKKVDLQECLPEVISTAEASVYLSDYYLDSRVYAKKGTLDEFRRALKRGVAITILTGPYILREQREKLEDLFSVLGRYRFFALDFVPSLAYYLVDNAGVYIIGPDFSDTTRTVFVPNPRRRSEKKVSELLDNLNAARGDYDNVIEEAGDYKMCESVDRLQHTPPEWKNEFAESDEWLWLEQSLCMARQKFIRYHNTLREEEQEARRRREEYLASTSLEGIVDKSPPDLGGLDALNLEDN